MVLILLLRNTAGRHSLINHTESLQVKADPLDLLQIKLALLSSLVLSAPTQAQQRGPQAWIAVSSKEVAQGQSQAGFDLGLHQSLADIPVT